MDTIEPFGMVAIASSAGGITALRKLLSTLPADYALPVAVVQHRSRHDPDLLPGVLKRASALPVRSVRPGEPVRRGTVYVAPPDAHLVVTPDQRFELADGKRICHVLSSANPLFTSAARALGPVIGVVLTGKGRDATDGVRAIKAAGGTVIVQDEATSEWFGMPGSAIETGRVDYVLPLEQIGAKLVELLENGAKPEPMQSGRSGV
jgi:two-component system chemotaxis response regulator CheB